jgi:hypothetical protein
MTASATMARRVRHHGAARGEPGEGEVVPHPRGLVGGARARQFLTGAANADIRPVQRAALRRDELPLHASVVRFPR